MKTAPFNVPLLCLIGKVAVVAVAVAGIVEKVLLKSPVVVAAAAASTDTN